MQRLLRIALVSALGDKLLERGSWCGETHLQKSVYLLQEIGKAPTEFRFILYKHGPFSFDLRDELTAMRADGFLELRARPYPYGPSLVPTEASRKLRSRYQKLIAEHENALDFVAGIVGNRGVAELERLATALFVTREEPGQRSVEDRARRLCELKPHISLAAAEAAIKEIDSILLERGIPSRPPSL